MTTLVPREEAGRVQQIFTRNLLGPPEGSDNEGVVFDADGERLSVEVVPCRCVTEVT